MANFWAIKWKSFSIADLLVNEKQKDYIEAEWIKQPEQRRSQQFTLDGETYSYNSIDSITRTSQSIDSAMKLLYASEKPLGNSPIFNADGDVVTGWYKKLVTRREYENYYGKHPSYITLDKDSSGVWVGFRIVERENHSRPENIELCTINESERLCKYLLVTS